MCSSDLVAEELYGIHGPDDFDVVGTPRRLPGRAPRLPGRLAGVLGRNYRVFAWALANFDVFHCFFDGGFLRRTPLRFREAQLLHLAGKRLIVMPYGSDNAVVKAAEVVSRLSKYRPAARLDELWAARVGASSLPQDLKDALLDPSRLVDTLGELDPGTAKLFHACTHTTISPNVVHGGVKTNVIPDVVDIDVDIRTLPGVTGEDVDGYLREALGELADEVEVSRIFNDEATTSSMRTPLWDILTNRTRMAYPDADLLPELIVGATDSRFFRGKGTVAYGTGLFAPTVSFEQFAQRFHGHDERVDTESLGLCTDYWLGICEDLLG